MKAEKMIQNYGLDQVVYLAFDNSGTDTEQLKSYQTIARVSGALGAGTVYLPPVAECQGRFFHVSATSVAGGNVTVAPFQGGQATAECVMRENEGTLGGSTATSEAITAANGWMLLYSDGISWFVIADDLDAA